MAKEKKTDIIVAQLLTEAGIQFTPEESLIREINDALRTASKRDTGRNGYPEYVAQSGDFILVIEDKAEPDYQAKYMNGKNDTLLMDTTSKEKYAENGALHYALKIIQNTHFKRVIAFGCSGTERERMRIRPIYVSPTGYKLMPMVRDFSWFAEDKIERYYNEKICENKPIEQVELEEIIRRAGKLHEDLRNYGQLGDTEKPLVVSAILLALQEENFKTEDLTADKVKTDGMKIFEALSTHLDRVQVQPEVKKQQVLDQFKLIKNRPHLSEKNEQLGKSPLRYYAEYLNSNILTAITNNSPEDVLGRFYGEFIRYSGGDGQTLGVVLTPKHITELFTELVDVRPDDNVFDPCCGTGGFLIAAMHRMLEAASVEEYENIRKNQLHGIELRDDMFAIATTNMILRGDGKSNLLCQDFLKQDVARLRTKHFTVGLMNPPYSQGKVKETAHLSELKFICHLLDALDDGARCAVIVPQSTMVGKTKDDKEDKRYILEHHTLEGVITLNPQTFYGVGVNPVIAVFTAHQPHNQYAKFIDFKDDGYEVFPHVGLLPTVRASERKRMLLECWSKNRPAPISFMVQSTVEPDDEWLHSFYYFNEEIPPEAEFKEVMADYLTFEFSMIAHGRGALFEGKAKTKGIDNHPLEQDKNSLTDVHDSNLCVENNLKGTRWKAFFLNEVFVIKATQSGIDRKKLNGTVGNIPYLTRTDKNNAWDSFIGEQPHYTKDKGNVLSIGLDTQTAFYQPISFYTGQNIQVLSHPRLNKYVALFLIPLLKCQMQKFNWGGNGATLGRLRRQRIMLPARDNKPDFEYMETYMRNREIHLLQQYINQRLS